MAKHQGQWEREWEKNMGILRMEKKKEKKRKTWASAFTVVSSGTNRRGGTGRLSKFGIS